MSENRFLQTLATVSASSVLVCGSLLLLTSTAPWTRPPIEAEPSTPDAPRLAGVPVELEVAAGPTASDQADTDLPAAEDAADSLHTAATPTGLDPQALPEPVELAETIDADMLSPAGADMLPPAGQALAALGSALEVEIANEVEDVPLAASVMSDDAPVMSMVAEMPAELAPAVPPATERPIQLASAQPARDQIADLLIALQARAIAGDTAQAATEEVADVLAGLPPAPPQVVAREKTEAARDQVADAAATLGPAPPAEPANSETPAAPETVALAPAPPPPPLPRRKPQAPAEPEVAVSSPPAETVPAAKAAVAAAQPRERQAAQPAPQQQKSQPGGLFGFLNPAKPMALAPADEPAPAASRPATARPSGRAYASQVWSKLARHKPRAGQRGSASVSFAIGANGSLGAVRIARSSGNTRIDQLALQTVRGAAPFPPPPSGSASYTIRIDF